MPVGAIVFSLGFRPFFLAAAGYGALAMGTWAGWLAEWWPLAEVYPPGQLHAHEMLIGFALAAIAGFLLTASPQWTASRPLSGRPLALLAGAWLLGRLAMGTAPIIGAPSAMLADLLFPFGLCLVVARTLLRARNRRNYVFIVLLGLLAAANLCWHLEMLGATAKVAAFAQVDLAGTAQVLMLDLLLMFIAVVGGRVVPLFTANWLRQLGSPVTLRQPAWLHRLALGGLGLVALGDLAAPWLGGGAGPAAVGLLALAAGLAHLLRLSGWHGAMALRHPLVWIMHLAYLWLCLALLLKGGHYLSDAIPAAAALHAAGIGAIGTMIMAIMPRVSLGHTGRPLLLPRPMLVGYGLFTLAALSRVAGPFLPAAWYEASLLLSGVGVSLTLLIFLAVFGAMLLRPRADAQG
ncbi:MAG: NnrS family protein [Alphaproteobacteria bacterium]|jgi:uncharacterized protein involved in response to NO|nr:NnrS family protein [Alphaproteobacteria bacterium]MDP6564708.1 NnrS family protein [Alphaproteobacteria bacterium]MDP6815215.1 NnrS family protein [Alphaproteobacteria bacterium]